MTTWHVYSLANGLFTGQAFTGDVNSLQANVPDGCGAADGVNDWQAQRVDLATGAVVDWQPPAPADDLLRTWVWHAGAKRWIDSPTLAGLKAQRLAVIQVAIEAQEAAQARPVRELLEALLAGQQAPQATRDRMGAISAEIARLQALRVAVLATQDQAALDEVAPP